MIVLLGSTIATISVKPMFEIPVNEQISSSGGRLLEVANAHLSH